jgi:hypothetical protein
MCYRHCLTFDTLDETEYSSLQKLAQNDTSLPFIHIRIRHPAATAHHTALCVVTGCRTSGTT